MSGVAGAYDTVADTYADHFRGTEPEQPVDVAMIAHFAALLPGQRRVLDAGCGGGRMLPVLSGLRCRPEGVDLSGGMVRRARQDHPAYATAVASLDALPYADATFDGVFSWYSTIHTDDAGLPAVLTELARVTRPGGAVLVAFQTGQGVRDVAPAYRAVGLEVELVRHCRTADAMSRALSGAGLTEVARLDRAAVGAERDGQAVLIATKTR
ncbi:class I SAM-dependent methyltransferase [Mariniluteicoccus endophyticus]